MRCYNFSILIFLVLLCFVFVNGSLTNNEHSIEKADGLKKSKIYSDLRNKNKKHSKAPKAKKTKKTKTKKVKIEKTKALKKTKTAKNKVINPVFTNAQSVPTQIVNPSDTTKATVATTTEKEEKSSFFANKTVVFGGSMALVVAVIGGVTYRNRINEKMNSEAIIAEDLRKQKLLCEAENGYTYNNDYNRSMYNYTNSYSYTSSNLAYTSPVDFTYTIPENIKVADSKIADFPIFNDRSNYVVQSTATAAATTSPVLENNHHKNSCGGNISTEVIFESEEDETAMESTDNNEFNQMDYLVQLPVNCAYKAVLPWAPRCVDEIQLNVGDLICIKECYQDGYSLGRNLTTRFDGIFPTCCLANIGSHVDQDKVNKWQSVGMYSLSKRSVKPTKKAKRSSRGISLLAMPDWTKKLESLKLDSPVSRF